MRFGLCCDLTDLEETSTLGFDYLEGKHSLIASLSAGEWNEMKKEIGECHVSVEGCCVLFPPEIHLLGVDAISDSALLSYLDKGFSRMEELGCSYIGFGSPDSRTIPEGMPYVDACKALLWKTRIIAYAAKKHNLTVVIEAINYGMTNMINTIPEAAGLVAALGEDNVRLMIDSYHFFTNKESLGEITLCAPFFHCHVGMSEGRVFPTEKSDEIVSFIEAMRKAGYDGRVSIEAESQNLRDDSRKSLEVLRSI